MRDYVRVRDVGTGHVYSVLRQEAETNPTAYEILDGELAVDPCGDPLPGVTEFEPSSTATGETSGEPSGDTPPAPDGQTSPDESEASEPTEPAGFVTDPTKPLGRRPRPGAQNQEA